MQIINQELILNKIKKIIPDRLLDIRRRRWVRKKERYKRYIINEFHKIYYPTLIHEAFWLGVPALKCPLDCWVYQEIIFRTRPEIIIETGVCFGGSTLYLASILDIVGSGSIIGIDIDLSKVYNIVKKHPRVTLIEGNSADPVVLNKVKARCNGRKTMAILDSDHNAEHVLKEMVSYSEVVTSGSYIICEDTNLNGNPVFSPIPYNPGPKEAVEMFLEKNADQWEIDGNCEKFLMTCNPGGFLKKK
jgi:cephalosporin hydroxylase